MRTHLTTATLAGALLVAVPSVLSADTFGYGADSPRLEIEQQNGVRYVSGGVGFCERQAIEQLAQDFDLKLAFATEDGHYLSDVNVRLMNNQGESLLETVTKGPLLYADVEPGTYTVEVSGSGQHFSEVAEVGGSQRQHTFNWPADRSPVESTPSEREPATC